MPFCDLCFHLNLKQGPFYLLAELCGSTTQPPGAMFIAPRGTNSSSIGRPIRSCSVVIALAVGLFSATCRSPPWRARCVKRTVCHYEVLLVVISPLESLSE